MQTVTDPYMAIVQDHDLIRGLSAHLTLTGLPRI